MGWRPGHARRRSTSFPRCLCRAVVAGVRDSTGMGGIIINIASRAAFRGEDPDYWHYAAAQGRAGRDDEDDRPPVRPPWCRRFRRRPRLCRHGVQPGIRRESGSRRRSADTGLGRWPSRRMSPTSWRSSPQAWPARHRNDVSMSTGPATYDSASIPDRSTTLLRRSQPGPAGDALDPGAHSHRSPDGHTHASQGSYERRHALPPCPRVCRPA